MSFIISSISITIHSRFIHNILICNPPCSFLILMLVFWDALVTFFPLGYLACFTDVKGGSVHPSGWGVNRMWMGGMWLPERSVCVARPAGGVLISRGVESCFGSVD